MPVLNTLLKYCITLLLTSNNQETDRSPNSQSYQNQSLKVMIVVILPVHTLGPNLYQKIVDMCLPSEVGLVLNCLT